MTDKERIDWMEANPHGWGLISDDNGHWALVWDGFQTCPMQDDPEDVSSTFWIEKDKWKNTVRDAIDAGIAAQEPDAG